MILLRIVEEDLYHFGGLENLVEKVIIPRNWDLYITLILQVSKKLIFQMIEDQIFKKISKKVTIWIDIDGESFENLLLKKGVKIAQNNLQANDKVFKLNSIGDFSLIDRILFEILNFEKMNGLIPTVVQDVNGNVLMLAYSSKKSLEMAISTRKGTYFSRSRNSLWIKGEESGNFQVLKKIYHDCDSDALLFKVNQKNVACHKGSYSCFRSDSFNLGYLYEVLVNRKLCSESSTSYTKQLIENQDLLMKKIEEESREVLNFTDENNLIWELADLTYFLLVLMVQQEIYPEDIINELWSRNE